MPEQEELRLVVTLVDNASAGVLKLKESIKDLGEGASVRHVEKFKRETEDLTKLIGEFSKTGEAAFKVLGAFRGGLIAGAGSLALFGFEIANQIKSLGEYTDKLRNLGQLGKDIGISPAAIKNIEEQLKVFGVTADQTDAALARFAQRAAELQRDPRVRAQILERTAPGAVEAMNRDISHFNELIQPVEKLNFIRERGESVYRNARRRGESEERAADERRLFLQEFGYDQLLARAGALHKQTADAEAADKRRIENATEYSRQLGIASDHWEHIVALMKDPIFAKDSALVKGIEAANKLLEATQQYLEQAAKREAEKPKSSAPWWMQGGGPPGAPALIPFGGIFQRLLEQEKDQQKKSIDENTEAIKKHTSLLEYGIGGQGGIVNAAFSPGGGVAPPRFGSAEYPNLGMTVGPKGGGGGGDVALPALPGVAPSVALPPSSYQPRVQPYGGSHTGGPTGRPVSGPMGDPTVPSDILARAQAVALHGGPGAVSQFMKSQGYAKSGAWCGEFAASVVKSAGGTPPRNPQVASNWRLWGDPVSGLPQPGDVAVRRPEFHGRLGSGQTGDTGSHVTFVEGVDPKTGRFTGLGGNQGSIESRYPLNQYSFRRSGEYHPMAESYGDARRRLDESNARSTNITGTGKITVDVNAPKGTSVGAEGGGLFNQTEINRRTQMEAAKGGPDASNYEERWDALH
jgi:hypothetical protein